MIAVAVCTAFLVGWICGLVCGDDRDDRLAGLMADRMRLKAENDTLVATLDVASVVLEGATTALGDLRSELEAVRGEYASILDMVEECKAREAEGDVGPSCCMSDYLVDVYNNSEVS